VANVDFNNPLPSQKERIPLELRNRRQWINWKIEYRNGKPVKIPTAPYASGHNGAVSVTDPNNLASFDIALNSARERKIGLGFVFYKGDGLSGIDLDKCRNLETEKITEDAEEVLKQLDSYSEISPSGKGIHVIVKGTVKDSLKTKTIEVYGQDRFFTFTGQHLEDTPLEIRDAQAVLDKLLEKHKPQQKWKTSQPQRGGYVNRYGWSLEDIRKRDTKLNELLTSTNPSYPSASEADMATLAKLLFWEFNEADAVSVLRNYRRREKLSRDDYIEKTLRSIGVTEKISDSVNPKRWHPSTGYKLALEKEKGQTKIFGDNFHLERIGKRVFLLDNEGGAVASCKMKNVDGRDFKKTLKDIVGLEDHEINKITADFQLKRQKHNKKTESKDEPEEKIAFDDETVYRAGQLLRDPQFFWKIGKVFDHGFIVSKLNKPRFVLGEERNKRLTGPLLIGAAKLGMASIIKLLGESGTAKDTMLRMWLDILPIKYIERSYFTAAALRYSQSMKNADLLYIPDSPELRGEMGRQLRFMRSDDGGLLSEYATRDNETGKMTTELVELPIKAVATTSNSITGDPALESGMFTLTTNGSKELTDTVKKEKLKLRAGNKPLFPEDELEVVKCAFHILLTEDLPETLPRVPFAEALFDMLESDRSTSRRDPDKLCDLISLIAWFRRFQKEPEKRADADFVDLYIAFQIGLDALTQTMGDLDEKETQVFEAVNEAIKDKVAKAEDTSLNATIRDVTEITKIPYETTRRYLDKLVDKAFLNKDKEKNRNVYSVLEKNRDKKLIFSSMRSSFEAKQLTTTILDAVKNSSTHHEGRALSYFDPLTGDKIVVNFERNSDEVKFSVTTEINDTLYPYGEMRSSERSKETTLEREKKLKNLPIGELVSKNNEKLRNKPQCKNLTEYKGDPYCNFLQSLLADPKQCGSDCAGWEAS